MSTVTPTPTKLRCWGTNTSHEVDPTAKPCPNTTIVAPSSGSTPSWKAVMTNTAKAIAVGGDHTCAVETLGMAYCWGVNTGWSLGALPLDVPVPTPPNTRHWREIVTSESHSCGIDATAGEVFCWGRNRLGEVGNGYRFHEAPVAVVLA